MISKEFVFLSFLYIKLFELGVGSHFELGVEVNRSAATHHKENLLKFPLRSSCSEHTNITFVLLIFFSVCYFHL